MQNTQYCSRGMVWVDIISSHKDCNRTQWSAWCQSVIMLHYGNPSWTHRCLSETCRSPFHLTHCTRRSCSDNQLIVQWPVILVRCYTPVLERAPVGSGGGSRKTENALRPGENTPTASNAFNAPLHGSWLANAESFSSQRAAAAAAAKRETASE